MDIDDLLCCSQPASPDSVFQPINSPQIMSLQPSNDIIGQPDRCCQPEVEAVPEPIAELEPVSEPEPAAEPEPACEPELVIDNTLSSKPVGPIYSGPQMYPSIPPPAHMCDLVIQSQSDGNYKSCSAKTVLNAHMEDPYPSHVPVTRPVVVLEQQPSPPPGPKPQDIPRRPPTASTLKMMKFPTLFGTIREANITFCIDTSGSMYNVLDAVKDHLIEVLLQRANSDRPTTFNIIEFSTEVTQWSDKMVKCSPQTVAVAAQWIRKLEAKTGTNTLDALLSAFNDQSCDAVCLVTDGLPDQQPTQILDNVNCTAENRPVHAFYMQGDCPDQISIDFLQDLAMETYGSFHIITVTTLGAIERVTPIYRAETSAERIIRTPSRNVYPSNYKTCRVAHTVDTPGPNIVAHPSQTFAHPADPFYPFLDHPYYLYPWPYRYYFQYFSPVHGWSRYRPARAFLQQTQLLMDAANTKPVVPGPGAFLIGQPVLARNDGDGLFYLGTVKSQVSSFEI